MDVISILKELCDQKRWSQPEYTFIILSGPQHAANFSCTATLRQWAAYGVGWNKKLAKVDAAAKLLELVRNDDDCSNGQRLVEGCDSDTTCVDAAASADSTGKINAKGKLQEVLQARNLPVPEYRTEKIGGEDHLPLFQSTVTFTDLYGKKKTCKGSPEFKKSEAEQSAARQALREIGISAEEPVAASTFEPQFCTGPHTMQALRAFCDARASPFTLILADLDNVHGVPGAVSALRDCDAFVVGIAARVSYRQYAVKNQITCTPLLHVILHQFSGRDVTDMCLCAFLTRVLADDSICQRLAKVMVVSRDKMAVAAKNAVAFLEFNGTRAVSVQVVTDEHALTAALTSDIV
jgi:hypothetical protein